MQINNIQNFSPKQSPKRKPVRAKPGLSLTCPPPNPAFETGLGGRRSNSGFVSPALVPIPSPTDPALCGDRIRSHSPVAAFPWIINMGGNGGDGSRSPMTWDEETRSKILMAPHLSQFKDCFSPLPLTPHGDMDKDSSLFGELQTQFLVENESNEAFYELSDTFMKIEQPEEDIEAISDRAENPIEFAGLAPYMKRS